MHVALIVITLAVTAAGVATPSADASATVSTILRNPSPTCISLAGIMAQRNELGHGYSVKAF